MRNVKNKKTAGNLRAAILGVNDGLISNFCLIMGFSGGTIVTGNPEYILLAGFAGLLAGSLSMGAGEYVSVQAQVDLYSYEIQKEKQQIQANPKKETEKLKSIYISKGLSEELATKTAQEIINNPKAAIDTMAREELGLNPSDLGSPLKASIISISSFALGAIVPVIPFILSSGHAAIISSAILSILSLMIIGGITAINTGVAFFKGAIRMLLFGGFAAVITYISGTLIGMGLS
jgi:VIT1/CCC1 family predicted Fe2+/Mn2+ transporter